MPTSGSFRPEQHIPPLDARPNEPMPDLPKPIEAQTEHVVERAFLALELPFLDVDAGHGVVMDGNEEIGALLVGPADACHQTRARLAFGHEQHALHEAIRLQALVDPLAEV